MTISIDRFSKDHWSLLAYVEHECINGQKGIGKLNRSKLRGNHNNHPLLAVNDFWKDSYSTRLSGFFEYPFNSDVEKSCSCGFQILGHDDWDCIDDFVAGGFVEIISMVNGLVKLTEKGIECCSQIDSHRLNGGYFSNFKYTQN